MPETTVEQAERHVREGEAHVARQKKVIADFEAFDNEQEVKVARGILKTLERSLELAREVLQHEWAEAAKTSSKPVQRA